MPRKIIAKRDRFLFEGLLRDGGENIITHCRSKPTERLFPAKHRKEYKITDAQARDEYKSLFDGFVESLEKILHRDENITLWFEHMESLLLIYIHDSGGKGGQDSARRFPCMTMPDRSRRCPLLCIYITVTPAA